MADSDTADEHSSTVEIEGSEADTLSLDETDIDLGQLDDTDLSADESMSADIDLGDIQAPEPDAATASRDARDAPLDDAVAEPDDILGDDRYDKKLDLSGQWEEFDPDDDK